MGGIRDAKHPNQASLWESKIQLGERFFHEIITNPLPINMKILKAMKRSPLGLDLYLWLTYRTFGLKRPLRLTWPLLYRQFGVDPARSNDKFTIRRLGRGVADRLDRPVQIGDDFTDRNQLAALTLRALDGSGPIRKTRCLRGERGGRA